MHISQVEDIYIDTQEVEQVKQVKYLGSDMWWMQMDNAIKTWRAEYIAIEKDRWLAKKTSKLNLELRKRIVKAFKATVWSVALYGTCRDMDHDTKSSEEVGSILNLDLEENAGDQLDAESHKYGSADTIHEKRN